jgi:O-glycosyl hydrolase
MKRIIVLCTAVLSATFAGYGVSSAATVTVNTTVRTVTIKGVDNSQQTIDGFGVFGAMHAWWENPPYYTDEFLSTYIDSLGITLMRTELYPQPDQTDMYTKQIPYLRAIMAKAQASHEPLKVFASIWSPPGSMKVGGNTTGGHLLNDSLDAYGVYVANYVKKFNTDMGYNLYAVSPQNEPALCTAYNSACYNPDSFAPVVIHVAHQIKNLNVPVWIHYGDNIPWGFSAQQGPVISQVCQDNVADSIGHIMSMHYISNGEADSGSVANANNRNAYYYFFHQAQGIDTGAGWDQYRHTNRGKKSRMWNTEWGGYFSTWSDDFLDESGGKPGGAWTCARHLFFTLESGFNAVCYWQGCGDYGANSTPFTNPTPGQHYVMLYLIDGKLTPGPLFYVFKCVSRYLRPGAIRVSCTSSDTANVKALAFTHDSLNTTTIVLLNRAATQQSVTIAGTALPSSMNIYQTSPTQNCANVGTVSPGGTVTLPVHSITTLCNTPGTAVRSWSGLSAGQPSRAAAPVTRRYRMDGRALQEVSSGNHRTGGLVVTVDKCGKTRWLIAR